MTREEILKKSREENMGVDMADYEAAKAGIKYGWMVAVVLSCIFVVVDGILLSRIPVEMLSAVLAGLSTVFFSKYANEKETRVDHCSSLWCRIPLFLCFLDHSDN